MNPIEQQQPPVAVVAKEAEPGVAVRKVRMPVYSPNLVARREAAFHERQALMDCYDRMLDVDHVPLKEANAAMKDRFDAWERKVQAIEREEFDIDQKRLLQRAFGSVPFMYTEEVLANEHTTPEQKRWLLSRKSKLATRYKGMVINVPSTPEDMRAVSPTESARLKEVLRKRQEKKKREEEKEKKKVEEAKQEKQEQKKQQKPKSQNKKA